MEIKCTVLELKELMQKEVPAEVATDTYNGEIPPRTFEYLSDEELQRICKATQQELPKEEKN